MKLFALLATAMLVVPVVSMSVSPAVQTKLIKAAGGGRTSYLRSILSKHKVNVDTVVNKNGFNLLHIAVLGGHLGTSSFLIKKGADVNTVVAGEAPLHLVAKRGGSAKMATLLLDNGADINLAENDMGSTPLHVAAGKSNIPVAKVLIDRGATVNTKDYRGQTPLHEVIYWWWTPSDNISQSLRVANWLGLPISDKNRALMHSYEIANPHGMIGFLLENGADLEAKNWQGMTPLHLAARYGRDNAIGYLLKKGADTTAQNNDGNTPAMLAEWWRKTEILPLLQ